MPGATAITGKDTLVLNDYIFTGLADGDAVKFAYDEDETKLKVGKDGNAIFGLNQMGRAGTLTVRVIMGSDDDKYLNGLNANYLSNPSDYVLDIGSFFKRTGDGTGNINTIAYTLTGGAPKKAPEAKLNADGDPSQAVVEWMWLFANAPRAII